MTIGIVGTGWVDSSIAISPLHGGITVLGLRDVALSLPSVVGTAGAVEMLEPELEAGERGLSCAPPAC